MTMAKPISAGMSVWSFLLAVAACAAGETQRIPIEIFASRGDVAAYPIEIGMPFPVGVLTDSSQIRILDIGEAEVPCQVRELSRYADNSLRAVLLVFMSPVSANAGGSYAIEFGNGVARTAAPATPVTVSQEGNIVTVDSGALRFEAAPGVGLVTNVTAGGMGILSNGLDQFVQDLGQTGLVYGVQTEVTIEESGPIRAVILLKGRFGAAPDACSYRVRIHAYAGTGLVRMQQTVLSLDAVKPFSLAGWGLRVPGSAGGAVCGIGGVPTGMAQDESVLQDAEFKWTWGPLSTEDLLDRCAHRLPFAVGEAPGWQYQMRYTMGTNAPASGTVDGWLSADAEDGGIGICVRDFWQQYPKEFSASGSDVKVWLQSPRGAPFIAKAGTAKTHEILFDFSAGGSDAARTHALNAVFQDWPLARISPAWVCATGMFGPLLPRNDPFTADYNKMTDLFLEFIKQTTPTIVNRACWYLYGNAEFGDFRNSAFCNVPTEDTHAFFMEFLRGGDREWARLGARGARHYADIDVCHADTVESDVGRPWIVQYGGVINRNPTVTAGSTGGFQYDLLGSTGAARAALDAQIQSNETAFAGVSVPRDVHQVTAWKNSTAALIPWCHHFEGAMPYYMISGDRRATEVLREQCGWVRDARQTGLLPANYYTFRLSAFLDTYEATGDAEFLAGAAGVANELIADWKPDGYWYTGYGKHGDGGIIYSSRRVRALFRFMDVNVPEAGTGVDNDEVKQMLADCVRTLMLSPVQASGCTPGYLGSWAMVESLGLWSDETRAIFEEKALMIVGIGRKTLPYENIKAGLAVCPPLQYKSPFLQYVWNKTTQTGKFITYDPAAMAPTNIFNRSIHEFTCDMAEYGISYAIPGYPHFVAAWKNYHQTRIEPRMNTNGVLDFIIGPSAPTNAPPTCAITSPADGTTYTAPATVIIEAIAPDGTDAVAKVEFYQGSAKLGEDMTSPYGYTWTNVAAGTYLLTVKAIDNVGATGTSVAVSITVYPEGSSPPTVAASAAATPNPVTGTTASLSVLGAVGWNALTNPADGGTNWSSDGGPIEVSDPTAGDRRFYRLKVKLP